MRLTLQLLVTALVVVISSGCATYHRAETVLYSDGPVDRAIYQSVDGTPTEAAQPKLWRQVTYVSSPQEMEKKGWNGDIRKLPIQPKGNNEGADYFAAWGTFKTFRDIPNHFVVKSPKGSGLADGTLQREYTRTDYAFVVEHRWRETLTDVVRFEDMQKAREELAELLISLGWDISQEALGNDYDAGDLLRWARADGKKWLAEITDTLFVQSAASKGPEARKALNEKLDAINARYGLNSSRLGGAETDSFEKVLETFVVAKLCKQVRSRKFDKPVDEETAREWLADLKKDNEKSRIFAPAARKVIDQKYGGQDTFNERLEVLGTRIFGLYRIFLFVPAGSPFDYTLTVPGIVVETNGQILSDDKVRWQFLECDAYPLGYCMSCRSLEPVAKLQKDLLGGLPLGNRELMARFINLAAQDERLLGVLRECRKQTTLKPLYDYRKTQKNKDSADAKRIEQLLKLLNLPPQPPV